MYSILQRNECELKIVSQNSLEYFDYKMAGYTEVFFGTKKDCEKHKENICSDLEMIEL